MLTNKTMEVTIMSKFKAGDKVRCTNKYWTLDGKDMLGEIYTVLTAENLGTYPCITIHEDLPTHFYEVSEFELAEEESMSKLIDNQEHYTANGIEPIEIMKANLSTEEFHGWLVSNVWKYTMRYKRKNGLDDLKKANTYLQWLMEDVEKLGRDIYWKKNKIEQEETK